MKAEGWEVALKDPTVFVSGTLEVGNWAAAGFWIDDCIAVGSKKVVNSLADAMESKYGVSGQGEAKWVLGMFIEQSKEAWTVSLSQEVYIDILLSRFNLTNASTVMTPLTLGAIQNVKALTFVATLTPSSPAWPG
jgi:hypothetical protein